MPISKEQAERLCAYFATASMDCEVPGHQYTEYTCDPSTEAFSPERVQELIRAFVTSPDNI